MLFATTSAASGVQCTHWLASVVIPPHPARPLAAHHGTGSVDLWATPGPALLAVTVLSSSHCMLFVRGSWTAQVWQESMSVSIVLGQTDQRKLYLKESVWN